MTTEPLPGTSAAPTGAPPPPAAPSPAGAPAVTGGPPAAAAARVGFRLDPRFIAPLLITAILIAANYQARVLESLPKTLLAIVVAMVAELVLGRLFRGKWPHLASAYVTGISVGILVRSPYYWPYALCSLLAITSKYVLVYHGRHLWNPSNFGIAALLFLAPEAVASLSIQWDNRIWAMLVIWLLGSFIIWRLKRFHICATYVVSFLALAVVRHFITGDPLASEIAPITGPMYQLFIFFMITDPRTTVHSRKGQTIVAFCVALVEFIFRLAHVVHAPYYALFIVGPIANLIEILHTQRKAATVPRPA